MNEKKKDISMRLSKIRSELDEESYYDFNCEAVFENLYENEFICEYQVSLYNNDGIQSEKKWKHISYGNLERRVINSQENTIPFGASMNINGAYIPNQFKFIYRLSKKIADINFSPNLPQKRNSSVVNEPPKGMLGGNKWSSKDVEINSLVIKNGEDGYFECKFTVSSSRLDERAIIFDLSTSENKVDGDPIIFHEAFITETSSIEASEKVDVNCKVFEPMKWIQHSFAHSFKTEKVKDE